ncbi:MAG: hypothetical protein IJN94_01845 [Clostridia bacterium]|nr:hypothetical protein [Clostridia bacterium]
MSERIKLGLTRNRLFEFDNCVSFCGKINGTFDITECEKALKMLWAKEPILSGVIELCEDGDAFVVLNKVLPSLEIPGLSACEYIWRKKIDGIDFSKALFSFAVAEGDTLCVCAHTTVADARALMYLAGEFMSFYNKRALSVEGSSINLLSEASDMPSNVFSVVVDRLASGLEVGWQKKTAVFGVEDYKKAREKYFAKKDDVGVIERSVPQELVDSLKEFSQKEGTDASSLVAFAFYKSLTDALGGKRKYRKMNIQSNSRVFFEEYKNMNVGAFNSFFAVEKKKNKKLPDTLQNNALLFHKEIYKKATSAFGSFYNEFLFMRLPPSFADSQYMYCAGEFKHKYSKKLACTYGCANEVAGEFCSYNLNQAFWSALKDFDEVLPSEPLKMRSTTLVTFVENQGNNTVCFEYKKGKISDSMALEITKKAMEILENLR